jgi:monoamine oxidase
VITALADRLEGQIVLEHRLEALGRAGESYRLTFQGPGGRTAEAEADFVVLAVPFSVLRHVSLRVDLPARKRQAIEQLGYGTNSKLVAGVRRRVWRDRGFLGSIFSDQPFQAAYDHSRLQKVDTFGLTFYLGGRAGVAAGSGTAEDQCRRLMVGLDPAFPGTAAALSGSFDRFAWPTAPFALGSYACYTPGQWTTLAGIEGRPVGRLYFAGEHCHFENAGFMDSAARSGRTVARMLKSRISGYC